MKVTKYHLDLDYDISHPSFFKQYVFLKHEYYCRTNIRLSKAFPTL